MRLRPPPKPHPTTHRAWRGSRPGDDGHMALVDMTAGAILSPRPRGETMLDAYIIDRIRREREAERERGTLVPLRIEQPRRDPRPPVAEEAEPPEERGTIVIDFQL